MKRIVVLVLLGALILGLLLPAGITAQGPPEQSQPPQQAQQGPVLLTIAENLTLSPAGATDGTDVFRSEWVDVSSYRLFKFYAKLTPYVGETAPVNVRIHESPLGVGDEVYGGVILDPDLCEWRAALPPWVPVAYYIDSPFEGLYSKIRVRARNDSDNETVEISLYLLMATE